MLFEQDIMLSERHITHKILRCPNDILNCSDEILSCYNNLIMSFEQDDKLCKQDIKSFEQNIKSSEQVKNKTRMSLPGFRSFLIILGNILKIRLLKLLNNSVATFSR